MKNQTYRMTMLYDFYGDLLTDRQREFFDLYYNDDLSLSEIAENAGISRQGVRDVIVRAEAQMQEIEDKTGLIRRFEQMRGHLNAIQAAVDNPYMSDDMIHTMLDIVDVQTADYDPARSIINRQFDASRPRFFDDKNYDTEIKNGVVQ